jgi:hypothetical protein
MQQALCNSTLPSSLAQPLVRLLATKKESTQLTGPVLIDPLGNQASATVPSVPLSLHIKDRCALRWRAWQCAASPSTPAARWRHHTGPRGKVITRQIYWALQSDLETARTVQEAGRLPPVALVLNGYG